jgi:hypothetical protein
MGEVAAARAAAYAMLVYVQKELIVSAHVYVEVLRRRVELDHLSEVQYDLISGGGIRSGNPLRSPLCARAIGRSLCSKIRGGGY